MKLDTNNCAIICEQCGTRGPSSDTIQEAMRSACQGHGWGFTWEHVTESSHVAHFYCQRCKFEFCENAQ